MRRAPGTEWYELRFRRERRPHCSARATAKCAARSALGRFDDPSPCPGYASSTPFSAAALERRARRADPEVRRVRGSLAAGRRGALARHRAATTSISRPSSSSTARSALSGSSAATESPQRVVLRWSSGPPTLGGARPAPATLEEAAAVGPQVLGYEFAWKLRLRRSVQNSLPTSVWKLWISSLVEPQAHTWTLKRRVLATLCHARRGLGSLERGTCSGFLGKSANFCGLFQTSDSESGKLVLQFRRL